MENKEIDIYSINNINQSENNLTLKNAVSIVSLYLVGNVLAMFTIKFLNVTPQNALKIMGYVNLLGSVVATLMVLTYIFRKNLKIYNREKTLTATWVKFVLIPIYGILTFILPSFILGLFNNTNQSGEVVAQNQEILKVMSDKSNPIVIFFMIVVFAPIIEEILFRAIPMFYHSKKFEWLNTKWAMFGRIAISSLIFGSMHNPQNLIELLAYSSAGFSLSASVLLTNRIETSMGIHFVNNFIGFLALVL